MTKPRKLSKARRRALEKHALKLVASMGKALAPKPDVGAWFARTTNSDKLQGQNPLIGFSVEDTLLQVRQVVAVAEDAAAHEARLDDTADGIGLVLRIVRDALTKQADFLTENHLRFTSEEQARATEALAQARAEHKARQKAVRS